MPKITFSTVKLAWLTLGVNLLIILQGAVVRATGSGAGCGSHWPLCNGEVVPLAPTTETLVEYSHRLLSLSALVLGGWLLSRAFRARRDTPALFGAAAASFIFLVFEALLGAATVLLGLTGENATLGRGILVATHLVNSMLLVRRADPDARLRAPRRAARTESAGSESRRYHPFGRVGGDAAADLYGGHCGDGQYDVSV